MQGAPHAHILVYLTDTDGNSAPSVHNTEENMNVEKEDLFWLIEEANDDLISASLDDAKCDDHFLKKSDESCPKCRELRNYVSTFQAHSCSFTCRYSYNVI